MNKLNRRNFLKSMAAGGLLSAGSNASSALAKTVQAGKSSNESIDSHYSACGMCVNKCGLIARVKDGKLVKLDPNPNFRKSRGMLCARGNAGIDQLYDPDRIKYPLLRTGKRGEGKWKRLSWEEALNLAAEKLKTLPEKYPDAYRCTWWFSVGADSQSTFLHRFAEVFGSYNLADHESLCFLTRNRAFLDTFGEIPFADIKNTNYIIMAGANRFESLITPDSIDLMHSIKKDCKLVVLDPRRTKTAAKAHEWLHIKPGTDMAFMLALMQVITQEELCCPKYIREKTYGLEKLKAHLKQYSPEWAEKECGIPAQDIVRIARELMEAAPKAIVYPSRRSSNYYRSTEIRRSFALVNALLGNFDRPGGLLARRMVGLEAAKHVTPPWYDKNPFDRADADMHSFMFEEGAVSSMREVVLTGKPYPVKGLFTYHTNLLQTTPDRKKTIEMLNSLDFFICADIKMSDTAWMADLILPMPSYLERTDPVSALQGVTACACAVKRDPVVKPLFESRPLFDVLKDLAFRLDLGEFFDFTIEEYREEQLAKLPGAKEALEKDGVYYNQSKVYNIYQGKLYKTLSKKIELYNQRYEKLGLDPMPIYESPSKTPKSKFRMLVGRNACHTNTSTQNNRLLHELSPENPLWIHPEPAAKLGIKSGDQVIISSNSGQEETKALVTEDIRKDSVFMYSGFGNISKGLSTVGHIGASMAEVLEDHRDKVTGNAAMHETFVSVKKKEA